jgi:mersacidin/lichenicidin family type 2 lantibiotic
MVRAWKGPEYRLGLSPAELERIPANPAGAIDLSDTELESARVIWGSSRAAFERLAADTDSRRETSSESTSSRKSWCWRHPCLRIFRQGSLLIERQSWMWMVANPSQHSRGDADAIRSATEAGMSPW